MTVVLADQVANPIKKTITESMLKKNLIVYQLNQHDYKKYGLYEHQGANLVV